MTGLSIAELLRDTGGDAFEVRVLLRHALEVDDAWLIAHGSDGLTPEQLEKFAALVVRRRAGEPVAYITGTREFYGLEFRVTPAVLIPRPETELLVDWSLERITPGANLRALDLGTGSGCIAVSIARERPQTLVIALDSSMAALDVARSNARQHGVGNLKFGRSNWFGAVAGERFHVIVANPPYVAADDPHLSAGDLRFEPASALASGADGLDAIRCIVAAAPAFLRDRGWLAFEHGYDQAPRCRALLEEAGFTQVFSRTDLAGIERISGGCLDAPESKS